jgi:hypothetical protein
MLTRVVSDMQRNKRKSCINKQGFENTVTYLPEVSCFCEIVGTCSE